MLKKRFIAVITGLALLAAVSGTTGIVADAVGLQMTSQVQACNTAGGSGGGC